LTVANGIVDNNVSQALLSEVNSSVLRGSTSKAVENLVEFLKKVQMKHRHQLQFCSNGVALEQHEKFIESIPTERASLASICDWLGVSIIPNSVKNKKAYEIVHDSNQLWNLGETKYQKKFNDANKANRFMVSSTFASNGCIPYPKLPDDDSKFVVTGSGGGDHVSLVDHISIEWKGPCHTTLVVPAFCRMQDHHYAVIFQSIQRVYAMSCYQEYFSDIIVFAVCADMMWIIKYSSEFVRHPQTQQHHFHRKIDIIAADPGHLGSLWGSLTYRAIQRKQCGFNTSTADYCYLTRFLNTICPNLAHYCRTRFIGSSMNRVYAITLPQRYGDDTLNNQYSLASSARTKHLAVKVIASGSLFDQEVACLQQIWSYINQLTHGSSSKTANAIIPSMKIDEVVAKRFYAYGYMRMASGTTRNPPTITLFNPEDASKFPELQQEINLLLQPLRDNTCELAKNKHKDVWWLHQPVATTPLTGGVIIMHCGDYSHDGHSEVYHGKELLKRYSKLHSDLFLWLELIHNAGVLHRDLRLPNILRFKSSSRTFVHHRVAASSESTSASTHIEVHANPEGEWQLIDFNVSACLQGGASTADTVLKKSEAQFKYGGWRLCREGNSMEDDPFHYQWSMIDDLEMLTKTLSDIVVQNVH
jgi:hypothetical protein